MLAMLPYTQKVWAVGFRPLVKLSSVMIVCRNVFHNGAMTHTCYNFMKVLST